MNPKKRLKMSLNGERVDRPPCICPGGMMNMVTAELMERVGIYLPEAHTDAMAGEILRKQYMSRAVSKTVVFHSA